MTTSTLHSSPFTRYLEQRLRPQQRWYERKANRYKRWYMGLQSAVIVFSALIPLIVVCDPLFKPFVDAWLQRHMPGLELPLTWGSLLTALLSTCVMLLAGLEKFWQPQTLWFNYRANEEILKREEWMYIYRAGPYQNLDVLKAGRLLVERTEGLINAELSRFISQYQQQQNEAPQMPSVAKVAKAA